MISLHFFGRRGLPFWAATATTSLLRGQESMREQSQKLQVASEKSQDLEAVAFGSWDLQGGYENKLWQLYGSSMLIWIASGCLT